MSAPWRVVYREPASLFEIVDNASGWSPDKNDAAYRKAWKERFGISADDEARFARFARIRERSYVPEGSADTPAELLGRAKPEDRLAFAFYGADTLEGALSSIASTVGAEELGVLRDVFATFQKTLEPWLAECRSFSRTAVTLAKKLEAPEVIEHAATLGHFYGVDHPRPLTFVIVYGPPSDHVSAHKRGPYVLLEQHPEKTAQESAVDVSVPIHELGHQLSEQMPEARRRALSATFRAGCALPPRLAESGARIWEEPLAVALQRVFERRASPDKLDFSRPWYGGDPWVGTFAKLLYGLAQKTWDSGGVLDDVFARRSARVCDGLVSVAKDIGR